MFANLAQKLQQLNEEKKWESTRPQTPKNIAISLSLEAAEVLEHFQWSETAQSTEDLALELADVQLYLLQLAQLCGIDLEKACENKISMNRNRSWKEIKTTKRGNEQDKK